MLRNRLLWWCLNSLTLAALLAGCSRNGSHTPSAQQPSAAPDPGVIHVHGLGINPKDGALYAATHTGLFRIPESGRAERIGDRYQDTMGFTVAGPDRFLGSGHPDIRDYQAGRLPPLLGLVESSDAGRTWKPLSLLGQADFHALRAAHGRIYGYDSSSSAFMVSGDGKTWETRSKLAIFDFAVSPANPELILATTEGGLHRSEDGGRTWALAQAPSVRLVAWEEPSTVWGIAANGLLFRSADAGATWHPRGGIGGVPEALLAAGGTLYLAMHQGGIHRSDDGGVTWRLYYRDGA